MSVTGNSEGSKRPAGSVISCWKVLWAIVSIDAAEIHRPRPVCMGGCVMNSGLAMLRRDVLKTAGAGLATSLLAGTIAGAQTQIPSAASSAGPAIAVFNGKLYAVWKGSGADSGLSYAAVRRLDVVGAGADT